MQTSNRKADPERRQNGGAGSPGRGLEATSHIFLHVISAIRLPARLLASPYPKPVPFCSAFGGYPLSSERTSPPPLRVSEPCLQIGHQPYKFLTHVSELRG